MNTNVGLLLLLCVCICLPIMDMTVAMMLICMDCLGKLHAMMIDSETIHILLLLGTLIVVQVLDFSTNL